MENNAIVGYKSGSIGLSEYPILSRILRAVALARAKCAKRSAPRTVSGRSWFMVRIPAIFGHAMPPEVGGLPHSFRFGAAARAQHGNTYGNTCYTRVLHPEAKLTMLLIW